MNKEEGYLLCVFGDINYFKLAKRMIQNIMKYDTNRQICILTDNLNYFSDFKETVILKNMDFKNHTHKNIDMNNKWNCYGLIPKIYQYLYTPFEKTCFMDVDMIFHNDFTFVWDEFNKSNKPILIGGKSDENNKSPSNWHWNNIDNVINACGFNCPQVCGTILIYNKQFSRLLIESNIVEHIFNNA